MNGLLHYPESADRHGEKGDGRHPTSFPNHARKPPDIASMAAGSANGSTLQTPHATAPVAVIAAGASRNVARQTQINEAVHHVRAGRADRVATQ